MQELKFKLEVYEGPLDLMLSLIAKHKLNIYDIEISLLLEQFMLYLDRMKQADIEIAGEFLEMAARLIYIKSAALLPKHEAEEMKKELQGVLIEYAMCKQIALQLQQSWVGDDVLKRINDGHKVEVNSLYKGQSRSDCVAVFLALLELSKNSRIKFTDDNKYLHFVPKDKIEEEFSFGEPDESEAADN